MVGAVGFRLMYCHLSLLFVIRWNSFTVFLTSRCGFFGDVAVGNSKIVAGNEFADPIFLFLLV